MSASTANRDSKKKDGLLISYAMGAVKINKGTFVFIQAADGYAYSGRSVATITDVMAGVAFEGVNNSGGTAGASSIKVEQAGTYSFIAASATQTWVGLPAYAADDQTVGIASATTKIQVGQIVEYISSTEVRVRIDNAIGTSVV
jgi:hypothetical protein